MNYETILYKKNGPIATITLNRPEVHNAISDKLESELDHILDDITEDDEIRAVILTGNGRSFCAGADIGEFEVDQLWDPSIYGTFDKLEDLKKPVIAAVSGHCNGGGLELALCCDFRIAADDAKFAMGEVNLGVIPGEGGTVRLPKLIGPAKAKRMMYFGNRVEAEEAERIGLVDTFVPAVSLLDVSMSWAKELAEKPPLALRYLKRCVNFGLYNDLRGALAHEDRCSAILNKTEDYLEGQNAFNEKRKPVFKGK